MVQLIMSVLVQEMAWRRIGDKPLPEPMLIQFTDIYVYLEWDDIKGRQMPGFFRDF